MKRFRSRFLNAQFVILFLVFSILVVFLGNLFQGILFDNASQEALSNMWLILIFSFAGAFFIIIYLSLRISNQLTKPLEGALNVANELASGNFKARTYEYKLDETGQLSHALNILARNLQNMTNSYEIQQNRLMTLIENMDSGLILIDSKGHINLVNRFYKETFHIKTEDYLEMLYYEALPYREIIRLVEETLLVEQTVRKQVELPVGIEMRHFDVSGAPILNQDEKLKGVVLVFHDITELKKLEQMRKDFVANVSHELKTPVTSLKGFAETLLDGAMENKAFRTRFLTIILNESDRLQSLIQDLLDLSKMEQKHFSLNWQDVDLKEVIDDCLLMTKSKADKKNIEVNIRFDGDLQIKGDANRLKQVFLNLIANSITYTPEGGSVTVLVKEESDVVKFTISDNGIGIRQEELPRIFERFYRVDRARSRNSGGTGLGLAIVKHLVEAHQGHIEVNSQPGEGTTFIITLNKERLH
ncbi:two-component system histidine kinase PnpS [Pseudalkalibacillus hwajinpoensis]|uniref:two-component system histidine kinase PnpS n=1 Tax=Guptibacillus hwajinpoensis TaxID=208199 RepID=UPI001CFD356C|nr:HAMP domain-containing sensor histidine kinase [Pseudalkalibacillus hwajinpoensis]